MGNLDSVKSFLKNPIKYIVHHSKDYIDLETQNQGLSSRVENVMGLEETNAHLKRDLEMKTQELIDFKYEVENALETCRYVRTGYDVVVGRVKGNEGANSTFRDWIELDKKRYVDRAKVAEEEARRSRGFSFGAVVNAVINVNPRAKDIPVAFYDFSNERFHYNDATLKLLGIKEEDGKNFTLKELLKNIRRKDSKGNKERHVVFESLRSGESLEHFKTKTTAEKPKDLILTTRPFDYDGTTVGVGIFLYDPKAFGYRFKARRASIEINSVLDSVKQEFDYIKKELRKAGTIEKFNRSI